MLKGLVDPSKQLSEDQQAHIDSLQDEIDEIWNRRGDYQIDPDAWESMPIFMENITEEDIERNEYCAAMSSIVYDEVPPDEIAENRKEHGNRALNMALNPTQERRDNLARAACHSYTEALQAKGKDTKLSSTIYANRSLAQFIIGNYGHGLEDAQKAIILNPDYMKAYYRGAKCAERVRKYAVALDLLDKGLRVADPPPNEDTKREFADLQQICSGLLEKQNSKEATTKRTVRAQAAKISNMAHAISSFGIKISPIAEVTSDQMGVYGYPQPYFDTDRLLHVPILFMYDEFQQTDIMKDVACDCCLGELLEEMLPFPWDTQNRYDGLDNIVALYKIDDGVKMVEYYEIDLSWPLAEVFRCETYQMPKLLPVIHVLSRSSELLQRYSVHRLGE